MSTTNGQSFPYGTAMIDGIVDAMSSTRLQSLGSAFQRVKWHSLRFNIEGAYPSTSGGGYVACFVRDPDDKPPTEPHKALAWAMAQQYARDAKWYDSVSFTVGQSPDLLYTNSGEEQRLSSPGVLYIISKGGPAVVGSLTITFTWDVTFSQQTSNTDATSYATFLNPGVFEFGDSLPTFMLAYVSVPDPNPHSLTYGPYMSVRGMEEGQYVLFDQRPTITGEYNTGNDYVPIDVAGLVYTNNMLIPFYQVSDQSEYP